MKQLTNGFPLEQVLIRFKKIPYITTAIGISEMATIVGIVNGVGQDKRKCVSPFCIL